MIPDANIKPIGAKVIKVDTDEELIEQLHELSLSKYPRDAARGRLLKEIYPVFNLEQQ